IRGRIDQVHGIPEYDPDDHSDAHYDSNERLWAEEHHPWHRRGAECRWINDRSHFARTIVILHSHRLLAVVNWDTRPGCKHRRLGDMSAMTSLQPIALTLGSASPSRGEFFAGLFIL